MRPPYSNVLALFSRALLLALLLIALTVFVAAASDPGKSGLPNSMASTGDSITRAFNTGKIAFTDAPANSWSTGTNQTVKSQYSRLLAANSLIKGKNYNDAKSGAVMADLNGQVTKAVSQQVQYITILMGANDACTDTVAQMTPVSTLQSEFQTALNTVSAGLPDARVFVGSIPDVYHLWSLFYTNSTATKTWSLLSICQSMLANPTSMAQADVDRRTAVRQRIIDFNTAIAQVCAQDLHCHYDGGAIFNTPFQTSDVNTRDYFHPSIAGQALLASVSSGATFNFRDTIPPISTATTAPAAGGVTVTLSATDNVGLAGIEYQIGTATPWTRYNTPVFIATGTTLTYRAVDLAGNTEASHSLTP